MTAKIARDDRRPRQHRLERHLRIPLEPGRGWRRPPRRGGKADDRRPVDEPEETGHAPRTPPARRGARRGAARFRPVAGEQQLVLRQRRRARRRVSGTSKPFCAASRPTPSTYGRGAGRAVATGEPRHGRRRTATTTTRPSSCATLSRAYSATAGEHATTRTRARPIKRRERRRLGGPSAVRGPLCRCTTMGHAPRGACSAHDVRRIELRAMCGHDRPGRVARTARTSATAEAGKPADEATDGRRARHRGAGARHEPARGRSAHRSRPPPDGGRGGPPGCRATTASAFPRCRHAGVQALQDVLHAPESPRRPARGA